MAARTGNAAIAPALPGAQVGRNGMTLVTNADALACRHAGFEALANMEAAQDFLFRVES